MPVRVQVETLKKILEENGWAEYLQNLGLNGRTDPESFKECVPLATHDDFEAYIQRIADGDSSPILTGKPIESMKYGPGNFHAWRKGENGSWVEFSGALATGGNTSCPPPKWIKSEVEKYGAENHLLSFQVVVSERSIMHSRLLLHDDLAYIQRSRMGIASLFSLRKPIDINVVEGTFANRLELEFCMFVCRVLLSMRKQVDGNCFSVSDHLLSFVVILCLKIGVTTFSCRQQSFLGKLKHCRFVYSSKQFKTKVLQQELQQLTFYRKPKFQNHRMKASVAIILPFKTLKQVGEELLHQTFGERGSLELSTDPSIRAAMSKLLKPDPELLI
ncbi:Jasmonic acid-amido synthetase JAR1, partial [Cucurbita argyrosperma subsp. argyrosperma]